MKITIKKVAAIHDISGYGRASLTTVIPIISSLGSQVCPIPTAVLSTHTDGFGTPNVVDLTYNLNKYIAHWESLNLKFECIYSGYLGSFKQVEIISKFIDKFKSDETLVVIDPVMGDDGVLYKGFDKSMVSSMKTLITKADIITPNYTELCYLSNSKYKVPVDENNLKNIIKHICSKGPTKVIVTSVPIEKESIDTVCYDKENDDFFKITTKKLKGNFPGTGDIFTSVLVGYLMKEYTFREAINLAINFVYEAIDISYKSDYPNKEGVLFEKILNKLIR